MATTEERDTQELASAFSQRVENMGTLGALAINKGAIVALQADNTIVPVANDADEVILGRAEQSVPATAGRNPQETSIRIRSGVFKVNNDGTVSATDRVCKLNDDNTASATGPGPDVKVMQVEGTSAGDQVAVVCNPLA